MNGDQIFLYGLLAVMVLLYLRKKFQARGIPNYTGAQAKERVKNGSVLLDVRTAAERSSRSLPKSLHIPLHELGTRVKELERHRNSEIICYCASGSRSVSAAVKLKKAGFTAGNLEGGIGSWSL